MDSLNFQNRTYFFDNGLCFECQQCGACCNGEPGIIHIERQEIRIIADYLNIEPHVFINKYLYFLRNGYRIKEDSKGRCELYCNGCTIYPVRPRQCRTYPFWFHNLRSEKRWRTVSQECPGIGKGRRYNKEEIFSLMEPSFQRYLANFNPKSSI